MENVKSPLSPTWSSLSALFTKVDLEVGEVAILDISFYLRFHPQHASACSNEHGEASRRGAVS